MAIFSGLFFVSRSQPLLIFFIKFIKMFFSLPPFGMAIFSGFFKIVKKKCSRVCGFVHLCARVRPSLLKK